MRKSLPIKAFCGLCCAVAFIGCFNVKHLPKGEKLYTGGDVTVNPHLKSVKDQKELGTELKSLLRPKPNSKILGLQPKLWIWSISKPKKKGLNHWLHFKVGEPPVLLSGVNLQKNDAVLLNRLQNQGYFLASVASSTTEKHRKVRAHYTVVTKDQYRIRNVVYPDSISPLAAAVHHTQRQSLIKTGDAYNLETIKSERQRIDGVLKDLGFYYFNADFLIARVDSTVGMHQINLTLRIKDTIPSNAGNIYFINSTYVYPNYNTTNDDQLRKDTTGVLAGGYHFIDPTHLFKPSVLSRYIVFTKGDVYNRTDHNLTLSRFVNLGAFRFVKASFQDADTSPTNRLLNARYFLTPLKKKSLRLELTGDTKSNNYSGGELRLSARNRNIFGGAELFTTSIYGGAEVQVGGAQNGGSKAPSGNSYLYGVDFNLYVPRFITPIYFESTNEFVPKTRFNIGASHVRRGGLYGLNSINLLAGYNWKESSRKSHELYPIAVSYVQPNGLTSYFTDSILNKNPVLKRSFERQFFIGSTYTYSYSDQLETYRRNNFYFNANIDLSGNLLGAIQGKSDTLHTNKILGIPYAQYAKLQIDFRDYYKLTHHLTWANRILAGGAYIHGNSTTLPFIKAFFAGGSNSVRAFRARALGPGSAVPPQNTVNSIAYDEPGDIKLEANSELRTDLVSVIKGAFFVDAGNVWLLRNDPYKPGGQFTKKFYNDIAVGTGLGLRADVTFFVLRLDVAFPLRLPYSVNGQRWIVNQVNPLSSTWRNQYLIYNIAIGYPF